MSKPIIEVNNLSKKYTISHVEKEQYAVLSDVIIKNAKNLFSKSNHSKIKSNDVFWALNDINFDIKKGERVGIIGRNGAGKSTLLKILSRISEPTSGTIRINGRVASLLEVGTGFHPELTGRENIFLNGAILGMSRASIRKHFDAIVDFAGTEYFLDTPVKRYSSGMYVRLAFAVAAHLEPEILIVDEVLAVGDAEFQKKCLGKMEDVSKNEGRTILFVSHNVPAVRHLTEKIIYLKNGKVEGIGSTPVMLEKYMEDNISQVLNDKDTSHYRRKDRNELASITGVIVNDFVNDFPRVLINDSISIAFEIESKAEIASSDINLIIKNSQGDVVTTIVSREGGFRGELKEGLNQIVLTINNNNFTPGRYFVTVGVGPSNGDLSYDVLEDYPLFEIYNNGTLNYWPDRTFGSFFMQNIKWS